MILNRQGDQTAVCAHIVTYKRKEEKMNKTGKREKNMDPNAKLPVLEKICVISGGIGGGIIQVLVATFLMVYYTNVAGINSGIAASVIAVSKIFDGFSDIVMGQIINTTKSRHGKCRPWLLRMAVPSAVCMLLAFYVPSSFKGAAQAAYVFITYNLLNTICYTALGLAATSLKGYVTQNQKDRGFFGGVTMLAATAVSLIMASSVLQLCKVFGGGDTFSQKGWICMILIYAVVLIITTLIGFFGTTERVTIANRNMEQETGQSENDYEENKGTAGQTAGLWKSLKALVLNKYWMIFVFSMMMVTLNSSFTSSTLYYAQYILGDELLYTPISNIKTIVSLVGIFAAFPLMAKLKKRTIVVVGMGIMVAGLLLPMLGYSNMSLLYAGGILAGFGTGLAGCVLPGMLYDTLTYGQWKNGFDMLAMGSAGYSFSSKIGGSIGTLLLGWTMTVTGFVEKAQTQGAGAIAGLKAMYTWIPGILIAIALVLMLGYDLDSRYDKITQDLAEGKYAAPGEK